MAPASQARCEELRSVTEDVEDGEKRLDLSVAGALTLVRSDGVLTYLGFCSPPHPRVLCVTYSDGDMKVGDVAVATGGYGRPDEDHILLDPCMAAPAGGPAR